MPVPVALGKLRALPVGLGFLVCEFCPLIQRTVLKKSYVLEKHRYLLLQRPDFLASCSCYGFPSSPWERTH